MLVIIQLTLPSSSSSSSDSFSSTIMQLKHDSIPWSRLSQAMNLLRNEFEISGIKKVAC